MLPFGRCMAINRAGFAGRRIGTVPQVTRDLPWDAMVTVAEHLSPLTDDTTLTSSRPPVLPREVEDHEGLEVCDKGTKVFEPVESAGGRPVAADTARPGGCQSDRNVPARAT